MLFTPYIPLDIAFKNRIINGHMQIAQRGASATVTAGTAVPTASTGYPCVDRMFVYSTGANVTAAQVAGSGNVKNRLQITGAASVTAIGVGQRIEQNNSIDLAGNNVALSVDLANSLLTTVTWTAYYANTADTFGTIGTPTKTQIATGNWTVNSTITNYQATFTVPGAATTGIEILLTVGIQTSGTWTIGNMQLERGVTATSFDYRDYGKELILCQRYLPAFVFDDVNQMFCLGFVNIASEIRMFIKLPVTARTHPTGIIITPDIGSLRVLWPSNGGGTLVSSLNMTFSGNDAVGIHIPVSSAPVGYACYIYTNNAATVYFTGCEL
jgi:hypothetical protein